MQALNDLIDGLDLKILFFMNSTVLFLALNYVAIQQKQKCLDSMDTPLMKWSRMFVTIGLALCTLWMMTYVNDTGWQPWPPMFVFMVLMTAVTVLRAVTLNQRSQPEMLRRLSALLGGYVVPGTNVVVPREFSVTAVSASAEPRHYQDDIAHKRAAGI